MVTLKIELDFDSKEQAESFKRDFERKFDVKHFRERIVVINKRKKI